MIAGKDKHEETRSHAVAKVADRAA